MKAVDGITYNVDEGETVALVGESGCGKSVSALSILRLILWPPGKIVDGSINFDGKDLLSLDDEAMRHLRGKDISMVFQEPMTSLNPVLSICEQLTETLITHFPISDKEASKKALELLEMVGISDPERRLDQYPHHLSGGMRQRVMIAMALSCEPKLIIADEPVSALDVSTQAQIINLLKALQSKFQLGYLFISHDLRVVRHISDRVAVMYLGKIVETAEKHQLYRQPLHPYTEALLSAVPLPDPTLQRNLIILTGDVPNPAEPPPGCPFHPRCPTAETRCKTEVPVLEDKINGIRRNKSRNEWKIFSVWNAGKR